MRLYLSSLVVFGATDEILVSLVQGSCNRRKWFGLWIGGDLARIWQALIWFEAIRFVLIDLVQLIGAVRFFSIIVRCLGMLRGLYELFAEFQMNPFRREKLIELISAYLELITYTTDLTHSSRFL